MPAQPPAASRTMRVRAPETSRELWCPAALMCCICLVVGAPLFFVIEFKNIPEDRARREQYAAARCVVQTREVVESDCSRTRDCVCQTECRSKACVAMAVGEEGFCCEGECCAQKCCRGCTKTRCRREQYGGGTGREVCEDHYDDCCSRTCCRDGREECQLEWSKCWKITVVYEASVASEGLTLEANQTFDCGFGEFDCREATLATHPEGQAVACWYDTARETNAANNFIRFDEYELEVGNDIARVFGIVFMGFAGCYCLILAVLGCGVLKERAGSSFGHAYRLDESRDAVAPGPPTRPAATAPPMVPQPSAPPLSLSNTICTPAPTPLLPHTTPATAKRHGL